MKKGYQKLISFVLLLFLIVTMNHYSRIVYSKVVAIYSDPEVQINAILPASLKQEDDALPVKKADCCHQQYCVEILKSEAKEIS